MNFKFYFKTWTGTQVNYPPNGGGGGIAGKHKEISSLPGVTSAGVASVPPQLGTHPEHNLICPLQTSPT